MTTKEVANRLVELCRVGQMQQAQEELFRMATSAGIDVGADAIKAIKAGVMEIAELYVVNKSDRPGADKLKHEVEIMLGIRRGNAYRHVGAHHSG